MPIPLEKIEQSDRYFSSLNQLCISTNLAVSHFLGKKIADH